MHALKYKERKVVGWDGPHYSAACISCTQQTVSFISGKKDLSPSDERVIACEHEFQADPDLIFMYKVHVKKISLLILCIHRLGDGSFLCFI